MRTSVATLALAYCLALAACSAGGGSEAAPASASQTAIPAITAPSVPSPSPIATPAVPSIEAQEPSPAATTPPPRDPCKDPNASAAGLAPIAYNRYAEICLGMSFAEATEAMPGPIIAGQAECPWYATVLSADDPGLYVAAVTRPENPGEEIFMFRMTWQGSLANAASFPAPETAKGISVGSTTAEVQTAYPSATEVTVDDPSLGPRTQLVAQGSGGTAIVFDVTEGRVSAMYWGSGISTGSVAELCAL